MMSEVTQKKEREREELIDLLINRGSSSHHGYIKFKVLAWHTTVAGSYFLKRLFDITMVLGLTVFFLPLLVLTAILIKLDSSGPILFRQLRVGKNGSHFAFYKFRSMRIDAEDIRKKLKKQNESGDGVIFKMKKDPRITRVGRIIRKFSIDELPQLFNVVIGDMSLVGPRPPLPEEVAEYTLEERKRLHVTPGITCIWQVSGRSDIPFKEQVELDRQYIHSQSLWRDLLILLKTIPAVITGRGAY
jgi:exopolysaccharide biosynthesis polyprenyl glycosylphosphotransferase